MDKNEYNHITATYFLLAERKLRSKRQEQINKTKRPEHLAVPHSSPAPTRDSSNAVPMPSLLSVPRTPGDVPQVRYKEVPPKCIKAVHLLILTTEILRMMSNRYTYAQIDVSDIYIITI